MKNQKGNPYQMKPNELRIGNYVYPNQAIRIYADIREIKRATVMFTEYLEVDIDSLVPIPLTEKLLLKLGFERIDSGHSEDYHQWLEKDYPTLGCVYSGDGDYVFCEKFDDQRIYGLHQLQNLYFALTGEELEINL